MQMLYDSEAFVVVHQVMNDPTGLVPHDPYELPRVGYEIVDKRVNKEIFLSGQWAAAFQARVRAWQVNAPTAEELETELDSYCTLAQLPLLMH